MKSFKYCKRFIDTQVKHLNDGIVVDDILKDIADDEGISMDDLKIIITRLNNLIRRHYNNEFQPRISNQIINQILKYEREKITMVHEHLRKIEHMIQPLMVPDLNYLSDVNLQQLSLLINELPESRYLFIKNEDTRELDNNDDNNKEDEDDEEDKELGESDEGDEPEGILIQDNEEMIVEESDNLSSEKFKSNLYKELNENIKINETLLQRYEIMRHTLIDLNKQLHYKFKKVEYLKNLKAKLESLTDQPNELNKFKILIDSINYKMNQANKQEIIHTIKEGI